MQSLQCRCSTSDQARPKEPISFCFPSRKKRTGKAKTKLELMEIIKTSFWQWNLNKQHLRTLGLGRRNSLKKVASAGWQQDLLQCLCTACLPRLEVPMGYWDLPRCLLQTADAFPRSLLFFAVCTLHHAAKQLQTGLLASPRGSRAPGLSWRSFGFLEEAGLHSLEVVSKFCSFLRHNTTALQSALQHNRYFPMHLVSISNVWLHCSLVAGDLWTWVSQSSWLRYLLNQQADKHPDASSVL